LFQNATILTGDGERLDNASLYVSNGRIEWIGAGAVIPDATVVDAAGKWITPGLIDVHSHLSVYPSPGVAAHSDGGWQMA
jgi:imidazolonepropionase-like amidohydrolase